jgi:hypothetical protein
MEHGREAYCSIPTQSPYRRYVMYALSRSQGQVRVRAVNGFHIPNVMTCLSNTPDSMHEPLTSVLKSDPPAPRPVDLWNPAHMKRVLVRGNASCHRA